MTKLRESLMASLDNIIHLQMGLPLYCTAIQDPDQREELMRAKRNIKAALNEEERERQR